MSRSSRPAALGRATCGGLIVAGILAGAGAGSLLAGPASAAGPTVPASQSLVMLHADHIVRGRPSAAAPRKELVSDHRPLTGVPTILPVLERRSVSGTRWLRVRLPGRPNGHAGWITADRTSLTSTEWRLSLDLSERRVTVYRDGRVDRRFRAVIGTAATPTPVGRFFVEEAVALAGGDAGAPFALATSARSSVLQEFNGGPGQIALHGTNNVPGALGSASSHGCVRLSTRAIRWLAGRMGAGVPFEVRR